MSECIVRDLKFHPTIGDWEVQKVPVSVVDYGDGTWALKAGEYGAMFYLNGITEDLETLLDIIAAMLEDRAANEAAEFGDFETEPKEDERNTEAWLDKEG